MIAAAHGACKAASSGAFLECLRRGKFAALRRLNFDRWHHDGVRFLQHRPFQQSRRSALWRCCRRQNVGAIADVRSTPVSRFCPWFSAKKLKPLLEQNGIGYLPYGAALGGRPQSPALYCDGVADYEAMARQPDFQAGLDRLIADAGQLRAHGTGMAALPDVRGARAARLPPLSVGRPCARGTRLDHRPHPARRQRSSRMRPPNAACWTSRRTTATSLQLDRTSE